jgi:hypothetical protein
MAEDTALESRVRILETQVTTHEAVCAERYAHIASTSAGLQTNFTELRNLITKVALLLIAGMGGILATVVFK